MGGIQLIGMDKIQASSAHRRREISSPSHHTLLYVLHCQIFCVAGVQGALPVGHEMFRFCLG